MAHLYIPDELIDEVRVIIEKDWERKRRMEKKLILSATDVVIRALNMVSDQAKNRRSL